MFNLTVDTAHTFYVGQDGWLVHKQSRPYDAGYVAPSSDAARREAMRRAGIPTSAQPMKDGVYKVPNSNPALRGEAYIYEVSKAGGGTQKVVINYQYDTQHGFHWEAGVAKVDDAGKVRLNKYGTPQYYGIGDKITGDKKIRITFGGCL